MLDQSRRKFFKAFAPKSTTKSFALRPPYAKNEALFAKHCLTCRDVFCITSCQEDIIELIDDLPTISFKDGGCSYCEACANACPSGVLHMENHQNINANFSIDIATCLAWNGVVCSTCKDVCDERAIEFFGMFRPQILKERCTSCGFCFSPCPTDAIKIKSKELV